MRISIVLQLHRLLRHLWQQPWLPVHLLRVEGGAIRAPPAVDLLVQPSQERRP